MVALDARTGSVRWEQQIDPDERLGPLSSGRGIIVFGSSQNGQDITALSERTGETLWMSRIPVTMNRLTVGTNVYVTDSCVVGA